jgi:hypothetical protein
MHLGKVRRCGRGRGKKKSGKETEKEIRELDGRLNGDGKADEMHLGKVRRGGRRG